MVGKTRCELSHTREETLQGRLTHARTEALLGNVQYVRRGDFARQRTSNQPKYDADRVFIREYHLLKCDHTCTASSFLPRSIATQQFILSLGICLRSFLRTGYDPRLLAPYYVDLDRLGWSRFDWPHSISASGLGQVDLWNTGCKFVESARWRDGMRL